MDPMFVSERVAPSMIRYSQMTPLSFEGKQIQKLYYPTNQASYSGTGNNVVRIPISSGNAFLDGSNSYLRATFTNNCATAGTSYTFANSFHSLIDRIRIISASGQELENIMHYNHLHATLSDLLLSPEMRMSRLQEGYSQGVPLSVTAVATIAGGAAPTGEQIATGLNAGLRLVSAGKPENLGCFEKVVAIGSTVDIYIPLELSQLVGANKKYLPLFLSGELTLEITLHPTPCLLSQAAVTSYELSNVNYCASTIEFGGSVNAALTQMVASSGLYLHATCWSSQMVTLAANQKNWVNSERLKSVKSVLLTFSDPVFAHEKRITNRTHNRITSLHIKIGSDHYPNTPLRADAHKAETCGLYLNEAFKALGVYNNVDHSALVNVYNFANDAQSTTTVGRATFGLDLDSFCRDDVESGVNTIISNPMTFNLETAPLIAPAVAAPVNAYSHLLYDCIFNITPSGAFVCVK